MFGTWAVGEREMITRREFIAVSSALGLAGCGGLTANASKFNGSVIVIGAGAAGMSVGHLLSQQGVRFRILEASSRPGGRIMTNANFVDFPIALGGEWLHASRDTLSRIVNDDEVDVTTKLTPYSRDASYGTYRQGNLAVEQLGPYDDYKFINGTWLTFFEKHILPGIAKRMQLGTQIVKIDHSREVVRLIDARGGKYTADAVVVTVPPQIIKDRDIEFVPSLPSSKMKAFDDSDIWGGMKVFIAFKNKFYPDMLEIAGTNNRQGQKLFYDAAYGQNSNANVLGMFTVGKQAEPYQSRTADQLRDYILEELDGIFDGAASRNYTRHISQNWSAEKFIRQAYYADGANWRLPPRMRECVDGRVFFAGDTYTDGNDWGSVHAAAQSARDAVRELIG